MTKAKHKKTREQEKAPKPAMADVAIGLMELAKTVAAQPPEEAPAPVNPLSQWDAIPEIDSRSPADCFAVLQPECDRTYVEQFRLLRTQLLLHRSRLDKEIEFRTVAVMSTIAGEGKTFTAANLAAVLAVSTGHKVLLMDANPAGPGVHGQLGMQPDPGLVHALASPEDWMSCLRRLPGAPLYVMPRGTGRSNALNNVDFEPLPVLLEVLRSHFEWIILDGASFSLSADAQWLAALADGNLLVVRQGAATFSGVQDSLRRIPPERLVGVVMNERKLKSGLRLRIRYRPNGASAAGAAAR